MVAGSVMTVKEQAYEVKLEVFEGPFDLLFHLIEKDEIDIYRIPLAQITSEYLEYIKRWQSFDLEVASEFLVMAASLLAMKANLLLPKPVEVEEEEEETPFIGSEEELLSHLLEYRKFKTIAEILREKETVQGKIYVRHAEEVWENVGSRSLRIEGMCREDLVKAFQRVWERAGSREMQIDKENMKSITEKIEEIWDKLSRSNGSIYFESLFIEPVTKSEVIVTFLALLELVRLRHVMVRQDRNFGQIKVSVIPQSLEE